MYDTSESRISGRSYCFWVRSLRTGHLHDIFLCEQRTNQSGDAMVRYLNDSGCDEIISLETLSEILLAETKTGWIAKKEETLKLHS